ncbi:MocR-like pyridoxine biosynthesis transcription factor PdxR [Brachybacterium sp. AOP25-B2-12]|uniref:MocR-like pyridoxine biosynthesis transcription factor PdxR n=1 Tax=Brachybacterium sp. AOP25-B2-12 TaxID=3457710 RepID=UPI0040341097
MDHSQWPPAPHRPGARRHAIVRTARSVTLPLNPQEGSGPLPSRLASQVRSLVADGTLRPGEPVPSTRALAQSLGVARGSVVAAFEQLVAEGYLRSRTGDGTVVDPDLSLPVPRPAPRDLRSPCVPGAHGASGARRAAALSAEAPHPVLDLRPGTVVAPDLPDPAWRAAWREAAARTPSPRSAPEGDPALRAALADRLRRVRAVQVDPERVVVTAGARDGLRLVLTALAADRGRPLAVAFEEPGYPSLRQVPELLGHRVLAAPADASGVDPSRIPAGIDVLVVTPSHQYPLGGSLPLARRLEILDRAVTEGFLVVEDEHTAEWRWDGAPLPALAGLDARGERVVLLGSASSLLTPAVAIGHITVPEPLRAPVRHARAVLGASSGEVAQRALAGYLDRGGLERHLLRARAAHRRRLDRLRGRLADAPGIRLQEVPGGLAAIALTERPEEEVLARSLERGVRVGSLARYWSGGSPRPGVVIGFGGSDEDTEAGAALLAEAAAP